MREINFEFEELPILQPTAADGIDWNYEVSAWGRATIAYGGDDWTVSAIEIGAYARVNGRSVSRRAPLDRHHPFWKPIVDALRAHENDRILERIVDDMREAGLVPWSAAREHGTLNHAQTGVSR